MGYIEIVPGWGAANLFAVMDWSTSGDSGWCAGTYATRAAAVRFAAAYAKAHNRELLSAEILHFRGRRDVS